jgi:flavodoxin
MTNLHQEQEKLQDKNDTLQNKLKRLTNQLKQTEDNWKNDKETSSNDSEEIRKENLKLKHKVTQSNHDLKKSEQLNIKLKEKINKKIFDKDMNIRNTIEMTNPIYMNGPLVYVNKSGENEFTYLVTKANQELQNSLKTENSDLKECIKMLQEELLEIVKVKVSHVNKRYSTEFQQDMDQTLARHDIEPINMDLVDMPFDLTGRVIITKFQENIRKLRDFLTRVDKDVNTVFNDAADQENFDPNNEFSNIRSISHLRHLLKNYKGIAEAQEAVIEGDIVSRSKVPPPDEIITPYSRFRIISDREIDIMRDKLENHRSLLEREDNEIEVKKSIIKQKSSIY